MTTVLAYGDSNIYGYDPRTGFRYGEDIRWTGILQTLLGWEGYRVIEEGCNGRTTIHDDPIDGWKNGLDYLKPCLNSHKPIDVVILMLGSNDLKSNFGLTSQEIAEGAGVLVETIQSFTAMKQGYEPKIVLISPPEIGYGIKIRYRVPLRKCCKYYENVAHGGYSALFKESKTVYDLRMNVDNRGSFTELIRTRTAGQVSVNVCRPGITRGMHWHETKM